MGCLGNPVATQARDNAAALKGAHKGMGRRMRSVALMGLLVLAGCKTSLYSNLPEQEANEMVAILLQRGISADKVKAKDGTETVSVDQSQFADAVDILRNKGLPHKKFDTIGDVFKASGLVASPMQDRARFLYALSQELSSTVSEIDGVINARVEVVLPDNDIMQRNPTPSSASVFVRYDSRSHVDQLVPQIKMLVANSVEGLSYDKVSVILVPVARTAADDQITADSHGLPILAVFSGVMLLLAGLGFIFRHRLSEVLGKRNGRLPAVWTSTHD